MTLWTFSAREIGFSTSWTPRSRYLSRLGTWFQSSSRASVKRLRDRLALSLWFKRRRWDLDFVGALHFATLPLVFIGRPGPRRREAISGDGGRAATGSRALRESQSPELVACSNGPSSAAEGEQLMNVN